MFYESLKLLRLRHAVNGAINMERRDIMRENSDEDLKKYNSFEYFSFKAYERFRVVISARDNPLAEDDFSKAVQSLKSDFIAKSPLSVYQKVYYN